MDGKFMQDTQVQPKSNRLVNRRIALACSGGIGVVEVVKITRELRRHGAAVTIFCTPSVKEFIALRSLSWAAGRPVIEAPSDQLEYLNEFDGVVVLPATLNTISKSALGITDNVVTLLIGNQIGRKAPLLFVPAMNIRLALHPAYKEHRNKLEQWGSRFHEEPLQEDRMKMPSPESLIDIVEDMLS